MLTVGKFYKTVNGETMRAVKETEDGIYCIWHEQALEDPNRAWILFHKDGKDFYGDDDSIIREVTQEELKIIQEEINNNV